MTNIQIGGVGFVKGGLRLNIMVPFGSGQWLVLIGVRAIGGRLYPPGYTFNRRFYPGTVIPAVLANDLYEHVQQAIAQYNEENPEAVVEPLHEDRSKALSKMIADHIIIASHFPELVEKMFSNAFGVKKPLDRGPDSV